MADFNYTGGVRFAPDKVVDVTADKDGNPTKACNPITGVCLEGGGDSDFSTAEVTINFIKNSQGGMHYPLYMALICVSENEMYKEVTIAANSENVFKCVLYKGAQYGAMLLEQGVVIPSIEIPVVSGGVSLDLENATFNITGDGTITFTESEPE